MGSIRVHVPQLGHVLWYRRLQSENTPAELCLCSLYIFLQTFNHCNLSLHFYEGQSIGINLLLSLEDDQECWKWTDLTVRDFHKPDKWVFSFLLSGKKNRSFQLESNMCWKSNCFYTVCINVSNQIEHHSSNNVHNYAQRYDSNLLNKPP